jgi:hypothetical protein
MGWQALVRLRGLSSATVSTSDGDDEIISVAERELSGENHLVGHYL